MLKRLSIAGLMAITVAGCNVEDEAQTESLAQAATVVVIQDGGHVGREEVRHFGPVELAAGETMRAALRVDGGDADLYVRNGAAPNEVDFDCRPFAGGTENEICDVSGPGSFYIDVVGYGWNNTFMLTVTRDTGDAAPFCGDGVKNTGEICDGSSFSCQYFDRDRWSGGTATCNSDCSGFDTSVCEEYAPGAATEERFSGGWDEGLAEGQWRHYGPFNSVGGDFRALIGNNPDTNPDGNPGSGDVDLYVSRTTWPTHDNYDCRSAGPAANESCTLSGPGLYYVSVYSYENGPQGYGTARYSSEMFYWVTETTVQPEVHDSFHLIEEGAWRTFGQFDGANANVQVILSGGGAMGLGDADLYVRSGDHPTATEYDCYSYGVNSDERCDLDSPGKFFVGVFGYKRSLVWVHTAIIRH